MILDEDEGPGRADGGRYERGDVVTHIELRTWADIFAIAPLDANTRAKLAVGLCDNCLTCVAGLGHGAAGGARAGDEHADVAAPVHAAAPPFARRRCRRDTFRHLGDDSLLAQINDRDAARVVGPITKTLACGDTGVGASMAEVAEVVAAVQAMLARAQAA